MMIINFVIGKSGCRHYSDTMFIMIELKIISSIIGWRKKREFKLLQSFLIYCDCMISLTC